MMVLPTLMKDIDVAVPPSLMQTEITALCCDSRKVTPGCVFVCIPGTRVDGHDFAQDALSAGAAAVVTQRPLGLERELTVPSCRLAWAQMSANFFGRPSEKLRLIGITGTNGKTTTTYLLKSILESCGEKVGLIGTIRNMIGDEEIAAGHTTPDAYELQELLALMVERGCGWAVTEVSSHALDQDRTAGCVFAAGIFTNLTQDHLDYHKTMESYLEAKKRLFLQTAVAVLNRDDAYYSQMADGLPCPVTTFGIYTQEADYTAHNLRARPDGMDFELVATGAIGRVRLATPGRFSVYNALGAAACLSALGFPFDKVVEGLCRAPGVKGRAEVVPTGRDFTVVIDYAHTPDGIDNICRTLREECPGRLVTLFGCGGDRDKRKRPKMAAATAEYSDFLIVTSDNPRTEDPSAIIQDILPGLDGYNVPYIVIENRRDAIRYAIEHAQPQDIILLAGKGHETYQILADGTIHFDEREVVAEVLNDLNGGK